MGLQKGGLAETGGSAVHTISSTPANSERDTKRYKPIHSSISTQLPLYRPPLPYKLVIRDSRDATLYSLVL